MNSQLRKSLLLLSPSLAALALAASPSYATSPSHAQIYGVITENGTLQAGSVGISQVVRKGTGQYCILPNTTTLQSEVASGQLEAVFSLWSATWP